MMTNTWSRCGTPLGTSWSCANAVPARVAENRHKIEAFFIISNPSFSAQKVSERQRGVVPSACILGENCWSSVTAQLRSGELRPIAAHITVTTNQHKPEHPPECSSLRAELDSGSAPEKRS